MAHDNPSHIDFAKVMAHVGHMSRHFPDRKSGNGGDFAAARYIVGQMQDFGLDARLESFETLDSDIGTSRIALGGPDGAVIDSLPCLHVEPTPEAGITAELVDVGAGGIVDYLNKDVAGKFVLAEVSYAPATPEKARIAAANGAAGLILMNWGRDGGTEIPWRSLKSVWGNPTPESIDEMPRLPGVSISRAAGIALRNMLAAAPVQLFVHLTATRVWRTLRQPVAWLHAPEHAVERERFIVVSSHIDGWSPGVTDNISGMSAMLELARVLATRRDRLRRSVVFCAWNGHEVAEAAGSTSFVDTHWERLNRDGVAYLNLDSLGMKGAGEFHVNCAPELNELARRVTGEVFAERIRTKVLPLRRVGDQSFFGIGVPAITGRHSFAAEVVAMFNGATLGWYNHTRFDTAEILDPALLEEDLQWAMRILDVLARDEALPYRFGERVEALRSRYLKALERSRQRSDLELILTALDDLMPEVRWLDEMLAGKFAGADLPVRANGIGMRVARQLTFIAETAVGRYGQDSYGSSRLLEPAPLLSCLSDYAASEPGSESERLIWTKLIRLRHQITDAIELARSTIADFRAFVTAGAPELAVAGE